MTLLTGAVSGVFAKVYDDSQQLAVLENRMQSLEARCDKLADLLDDERISNASTRTMCERWIKEFKRRLGPE